MGFFSKMADLFSIFDHSWRNSSSSSSFDDHFQSKSSSFDNNVQTSSSMFDDPFHRGDVNPATGLPMINSSIDTGGNPFGCDNSHWSSSHDHWNSSLSHDSWGGSSLGSDSFGSRWND